VIMSGFVLGRKRREGGGSTAVIQETSSGDQTTAPV